MTLLATMPPATAPGAPTSGSHRVTYKDGKATVHELGLMAGYDPELHGNDAKMREWTVDNMRELFRNTQRMIEEYGQYPAVACSHPNRLSNMSPLFDDRPAIGRASNLQFRVSARGVPFIVGDMTMSIEEFEAKVRSNRYTRRSVELYSAPLRIGAVALLGGDTPKTQVEDTHFSARPVAVIESPDRTLFTGALQTGPGLNNFIPSSTTQEPKMSQSRFNDDERKEIADMCATAVGSYMANNFNAMFSAAMRKYSEDTKDDKDGKGPDFHGTVVPAVGARPVTAAAGAPADPAAALAAAPAAAPAPAPSTLDFSAQLALRDQRIQQLELANRAQQADTLIAQMSAAGAVIPAEELPNVRAMIANAPNPVAMAQTLFNIGARIPLGREFNGTSLSGAPGMAITNAQAGLFSAAATPAAQRQRELTPEQSERLTAQFGGDRKGFEAARAAILNGTGA